MAGQGEAGVGRSTGRQGRSSRPAAIGVGGAGLGKAGLGLARLGWAWQGRARLGEAWHGKGSSYVGWRRGAADENQASGLADWSLWYTKYWVVDTRPIAPPPFDDSSKAQSTGVCDGNQTCSCY